MLDGALPVSLSYVGKTFTMFHGISCCMRAFIPLKFSVYVIRNSQDEKQWFLYLEIQRWQNPMKFSLWEVNWHLQCLRQIMQNEEPPFCDSMGVKS
jgi:hypothetical protein